MINGRRHHDTMNGGREAKSNLPKQKYNEKAHARDGAAGWAKFSLNQLFIDIKIARRAKRRHEIRERIHRFRFK